MKAIQPINVWKDGELVTVNFLNLISVFDDLSTTANFLYQLQTEVIVPPINPEEPPTTSYTVQVEGNSALQGQEYDSWGDSGNINDDAYTLIAAKLNLTLV